ncbi:hypothetical protein JCM10207_007656 [Rhodosporidiobolus poonsookiae]
MPTPTPSTAPAPLAAPSLPPPPPALLPSSSVSASPTRTARPARLIPRIPPPLLSPTSLAALERPASPATSSDGEGNGDGMGVAQVLDLYALAAAVTAAPAQRAVDAFRALATYVAGGTAGEGKKAGAPLAEVVFAPSSDEKASKGTEEKQENQEKQEKQEREVKLVLDARRKKREMDELKLVDAKIGRAMESWGF